MDSIYQKARLHHLESNFLTHKHNAVQGDKDGAKNVFGELYDYEATCVCVSGLDYFL